MINFIVRSLSDIQPSVVILTCIPTAGKAQSFDFDSPESEPADTFTMNLRRYQKQALHWLLNKEKNTSDKDNESMHPLWEEYLWPTKDANDEEIPKVTGKEKFYVNPYSGELSLEFPRQEQNCLGGILADGMPGSLEHNLGRKC